MKNPTVSIIIRTKNEEKWLGKVLEKLYQQTFKDFEVIIVDSGSTDKTLAIAKKFPVKIYRIKLEEFSYPYALNYGISKSKGKYLAILSGHSLPVSNTWLEDGLKNFQNPKVAGIDGYIGPLPDASIWEKIGLFDGHLWLRLGNLGKKIMARSWKPLNYTLTNTNSLIRRDLWEKYPFDESLAGSEDEDWAKEMWARGYVTIRDGKFTVRHSHGRSLGAIRKRNKIWAERTKIIDASPRPRKSFTRIKIGGN